MLPAVINELFVHGPGQARERICDLEAAMLKGAREGDFVDEAKTMPLRHLFVPGIYARELTIPAGMLLVGKIHRGPCFNVVLSGDITVLTEDGMKRIVAPAFFRSEAGVKRVGYAHSDTVWMTLHGTDETDPDRLEDTLTCERYEDLGQIESIGDVAALIDAAQVSQ